MLGDQLDVVKDDPNIKYEMLLRSNPQLLGVNMEHPALNNLYVRKAISAIIPREMIANKLLMGQAIPSTNILCEMSWVYNSSISFPKYNVEQARAYMEMAGYNFEWLEPPPGTPLSEHVPYAIVGLVIGLVIGVATRYLSRVRA